MPRNCALSDGSQPVESVDHRSLENKSPLKTIRGTLKRPGIERVTKETRFEVTITVKQS